MSRFDWLVPDKLTHFANVYIDASGEDFGIGILIENLGAFQCDRSFYEHILKQWFKKEKRKNPTHIQFQELAAYLLAVWFITKHTAKTSGKQFNFVLDNQVVFFNASKTSFKVNFTANLLLLKAGNLLHTT